MLYTAFNIKPTKMWMNIGFDMNNKAIKNFVFPSPSKKFFDNFYLTQFTSKQQLVLFLSW